MINREMRPVFCVLIAGALFAAGTPLAKLLLTDISPLALASVLYLGSATGLSVFFLILKIFSGKKSIIERKRKEAPPSGKDIPWLLASVFFGSVISTIILMVSLQHTSAVTASMLLSFEAVAGTMVAATIFHEHVGRRIWIALGLITIACLALTYSPGSEFGFSLGAAGVIITCISWGIDTNISRKISSKDPVLIVLAKGWIGGFVLFSIAFISGAEFPPPGIMIPAMAVGFLSFGGLMVILYLYGLRGLGAARASSIFGMNPAFGVIISVLLFQEMPGLIFFLVLPVMAAGLYLLATEKHAHLHTHPKETHEHRHFHPDIHHDHIHLKTDPPVDKSGYHSHIHTHEELSHIHPHRPDIHHRHSHN